MGQGALRRSRSGMGPVHGRGPWLAESTRRGAAPASARQSGRRAGVGAVGLDLGRRGRVGLGTVRAGASPGGAGGRGRTGSAGRVGAVEDHPELGLGPLQDRGPGGRGRPAGRPGPRGTRRGSSTLRLAASVMTMPTSSPPRSAGPSGSTPVTISPCGSRSNRNRRIRAGVGSERRSPRSGNRVGDRAAVSCGPAGGGVGVVGLGGPAPDRGAIAGRRRGAGTAGGGPG